MIVAASIALGPRLTAANLAIPAGVSKLCGPQTRLGSNIPQ